MMSDEHTPTGRSDVDATLVEAAALGEEEEWPRAFSLLLTGLDRWPDHPGLLCALGTAARHLGEEGEAYSYFRRCLAQNPEDPAILATAGSGLALFDDPEAERVLRLAALSAPQLPLARLQYGAYLAREGMWEPAVRELEAARSLAEDDPLVRMELAVAYALAGRTEDSVPEMEEALARQDEDPWLRSLYALLLLETGRDEEAAEELHRASLEEVEDAELQMVTALAAAAQGWEEEGWNALARAEAAFALAGGEEMLLQEVEDALHAGGERAEEVLVQELAPSLLRRRLLQRP